MIAFERECETRLRKEFEKQLEQVIEMEVSRARLEESHCARQELALLALRVKEKVAHVEAREREVFRREREVLDAVLRERALLIEVDLKAAEADEWRQRCGQLESSMAQQLAAKEEMVLAEKKASEAVKAEMTPLLQVIKLEG